MHLQQKTIVAKHTSLQLENNISETNNIMDINMNCNEIQKDIELNNNHNEIILPIPPPKMCKIYNTKSHQKCNNKIDKYNHDINELELEMDKCSNSDVMNYYMRIIIMILLIINYNNQHESQFHQQNIIK